MSDFDAVHLLWIIPVGLCALVLTPIAFGVIHLACGRYSNEEIYNHG
ncbi:hypothetical protein GURKE_01340 [Brevundimonas phage vB_BpoS-Gurke]|uniref:Uncharacterized protein n=1 Tax=Brevundimonas phage vB_BpoS-Gurke TaxID=2948599 RepID=A0A9E7N3G2_9CAUD|nr:hypothetical protein GURKE_01340 [Brevundimonas phage vB_BpoS-Gurke]